jgi:hypothetical protein
MQITSFSRNLTIVKASCSLTNCVSNHLKYWSIVISTYLLPPVVSGYGPTVSIADDKIDRI